jgi:hypothetical protein
MLLDTPVKIVMVERDEFGFYYLPLKAAPLALCLAPAARVSAAQARNSS